MTFHNEQFPVDGAYGSTSGLLFNTEIIEVGSGKEYRSQRWQSPKDTFEVATAVKSWEDMQAVTEFFMERRGSWASFRFKDWFDYATSSAWRTHPSNLPAVGNQDQIIGVGDGETKTFQLRKGYGSGDYKLWRTITLPRANTVTVALDGVNQASGWTVDDTTGILTFTTAPGDGVQITAGFEFDKRVRFANGNAQPLIVALQAYDAANIPSLRLVEVIDDANDADGVPHGGHHDLTSMSDSVSLSLAKGQLVTCTPSVANLQLFLPAYTDIGEGKDYFLIRNTSGTHTLALRTQLGQAVTTIGTSSAVRVHLTRSGSSATWITTAA